MYTCPVCGYNELQYPPSNFTVCPSCYTEFGYDDATLTHEDLRREWIGNGMPWMGMNVTPPPTGWNPYKQLANLDDAIETKIETITEGSVIGIVDIRERVVIVQDVPRTEIRGRWQIIGSLAEGVRIAHA